MICLNACEWTASITAAANLLAKGLTVQQIGLLAASFTQLGDTLATIAVQREVCTQKDSPNS